jgi:hypothetical protein
MTKVKDLITKEQVSEGGWAGAMYEYKMYDGTETDFYDHLALKEFLEKHPRFKDAVIMERGAVFGRYPFRHRYRSVNNNEMWKVRIGDKFTYALGISRPWRGYDTMPKIIQRRFYEDGEKPIKRKVRKVDVEYVDHGKGQSTYGRDCQLRTLATVMGQDYFDVHREMSDRGWKPNHVGNVHYTTGHKKNRWDEVMEVFGYEKERVWTKKNLLTYGCEVKSKLLKHKTGMTVATAACELPRGTYIVSMRSHVCAVIDNKIFDSWNCQNKHVHRIWKVNSIK